MRILKALDSALTAFVNELWPFDFPLAWFDPGDALEDEIVSKGVFAESSPVVARQAPGELSPDGDGGPPSPPSPSGYPNTLSPSDVAMQMIMCVTGARMDDALAHKRTSEIVYMWIHEPEHLTPEKAQDVLAAMTK